jgi:hypothetical protein
MTKSEFERRAAQMKEQQLAKRQYRTAPPPRSIIEPIRQPVHAKVKVHFRDFVPEGELNQIGPQLSAIKNFALWKQIETDYSI